MAAALLHAEAAAARAGPGGGGTRTARHRFFFAADGRARGAAVVVHLAATVAPDAAGAGGRLHRIGSAALRVGCEAARALRAAAGALLVGYARGITARVLAHVALARRARAGLRADQTARLLRRRRAPQRRCDRLLRRGGRDEGGGDRDGDLHHR